MIDENNNLCIIIEG